MVSFVEDSERVTKVVFNSALGRHPDLVFGGRILITNFTAFAGLLWFLLVDRIRRVILAGFGGTASFVLGSLCILRASGRLLCLFARFFCVRGWNSVAHLEFEYPHELLI